jgi:hypothetical protein
MATRADGTLPRAGKPATDAAKEAHAILVTAERGLTDSLAKPKVSNAKSLTGAFRSVTLRDGTDPSVASAFAAFGEGAAEVRRLGDDGPGGKGVVRRLEGVAAMKQSRKERHQSAVEAWEKERDRVVDEELAGEAAALVKAFREKIDISDAKIAAIMDPFAPDVVRGEHVSTLRTETEEAVSDDKKAEEDEGESAAAEPTEDADPAAAAVPRMAGVKMEGELAGLASPPYKGNTVPGRLSSIFRRGGGADVDGSAPAKLGKEPVAKDDVLEVMRQLEQQNSRDYAQAEQFLAAAAAKDGSKRSVAAGDSPSLYLMR